LAYQP